MECNRSGHPTGISSDVRRRAGDEARPMAHCSQRDNFNLPSGSTSRLSAFRMDYDDSSDFDSDSSDSDGDSVILTPASHVHSPLSPTAAGFIPTVSQSSNTVTYPCHPFEPMRPALPTQPGMGFSQPTHPGMGLPPPIHPGMGSQGAALQYGGYAYSPYGSYAHSPYGGYGYAHMRLSQEAVPFAPPGSEKMKTLGEMTAALKGRDSSAGPHQPHTNTSNAAKTQDPLHMFHALNSSPNTFPLRTSGMPQPLSIPTATPAFDMDIASKIRNLENLHNCHSKQLATHEHTLKSITKENDNLRSMRDEDRETIQELTAALTKAKSSGTDQSQVEYLAKSLCDVRVRLDVLSMKEKSAPSPAMQNLTTESKLKLEGIYETQKMQSTSISAVTGQVGALDRLFQGTGGALNKEMQTLNSILVVQAGKIQALESDGNEMRATIARLQQDKGVVSAELHHVKSRLSDASFDARFYDEFYDAKDSGTKISKQDDEIVHLRSMLDRCEENYESQSRVVEKIRGELAETKAEAGRSLFAHRANATADRERWIQIDSKVTKVQGDVTGLQKLVQHNTIDTDMALERLSDDIADLDKRTDEGVIVTDTRVAAAVSRITKVEDEISAIRAQVAHGLSSSHGVAQHDVAQVGSDLHTTNTKIDELSAAIAGMNDKNQQIIGEVQALHPHIRSEIDGVRETNKLLAGDITCMRETVKELQDRFKTVVEDAVSEVTLEHVVEGLSTLRSITKSLSKTNEETTAKLQSVEFAVADGLRDLGHDLSNKTQTLEGAIDDLRNDVESTKAEQDSKIAAATTQSVDQARATQEVTSNLKELDDCMRKCLAAHRSKLTTLTTRLDELQTAQCNNQASSEAKQATIEEQLSELEARADGAAQIDAVLARIQAARDASKEDDRIIANEANKEIRRVDESQSSLVKDISENLASQILFLSSQITELSAQRTNNGNGTASPSASSTGGAARVASLRQFLDSRHSNDTRPDKRTDFEILQDLSRDDEARSGARGRGGSAPRGARSRGTGLRGSFTPTGNWSFK